MSSFPPKVLSRIEKAPTGRSEAVQWPTFTSGPSMLEAANANAVDVGQDSGVLVNVSAFVDRRYNDEIKPLAGS